MGRASANARAALSAFSYAAAKGSASPSGLLTLTGRGFGGAFGRGLIGGFTELVALAGAARGMMHGAGVLGIRRQKIFSLAASTTQQPISLRATTQTTIQLRASGMTATNNVQTVVTAGDAFSLTFPILDASGVPSVYSAPVASFAVSAWPFAINDQTPALEKTSPSNGVTIVQQTVNGVLTWVATVSFVTADTESPVLMPGAHFYQLRVVDGGPGQTVATGTLLINPTIIP
jgi:hypothetical protein